MDQNHQLITIVRVNFNIAHEYMDHELHQDAFK